MCQCCSAGGELIAAKQVDHRGTCHVLMAGQVTNERKRGEGRGGVSGLGWGFPGLRGGEDIKVALLTSMRAARPAMKARR